MSCGDFDFWLGRWRGTWAGGSAVNEISKRHDGRVILEEFQADPPDAFSGMSVSVVDESSGRWRQTWVDSDGDYLDFAGGRVEDEMQFSRRSEDGVAQKMVWTDVEADRFEWYWLRCEPGGEWEAVWHISYERLA